jgi:hypothetical protein
MKRNRNRNRTRSYQKLQRGEKIQTEEIEIAEMMNVRYERTVTKSITSTIPPPAPITIQRVYSANCFPTGLGFVNEKIMIPMKNASTA